MKYGIREICDVVLKAKSDVTIGGVDFEAGMPVLYFDSLKTSTMEGAATTVYAQGGKGNARLVAWEGERTVTFTMEDALISDLGLAVLTGANLIDASDAENFNPVHVTETVEVKDKQFKAKETFSTDTDAEAYYILLDDKGNMIDAPVKMDSQEVTLTDDKGAKSAILDYYVLKSAGKQIEITADKFAGTYYLEASTLFRDENGVDHAAEFVIPKCKIQSNFTFTMASSGDPSTFTFTMDAFPDYTKFDPTKKVFATIQVLDEVDG